MTKTNDPTLGSLFTGTGALDLAVAAHYRARLIWWSEIDPNAATIHVRHTNTPNLGDITQWVPHVELVMARKPDHERTAAMYRYYIAGHSLAEVGTIFGVTRQSVYERMKRNDLPLRSKPEPDVLEWNGRRFTFHKGIGYYRETSGDRTLMHRAIWEHHNDTIPDGWDVHHVDGNRTNNSIDNLECLPKAEHTANHISERGTAWNQYGEWPLRTATGEVMPSEALRVDIMTGGFP